MSIHKHKLGDWSQLEGQTILYIDSNNITESPKSQTFVTNEGRFELTIYDENYGCNDSYAYISEMNGFEKILRKKIVKAYSSNRNDIDGEDLLLCAEDGTQAYLSIVHESNGYYSYHYDLVKNSH